MYRVQCYIPTICPVCFIEVLRVNQRAAVEYNTSYRSTCSRLTIKEQILQLAQATRASPNHLNIMAFGSHQVRKLSNNDIQPVEIQGLLILGIKRRIYGQSWTSFGDPMLSSRIAECQRERDLEAVIRLSHWVCLFQLYISNNGAIEILDKEV